MKRIMTIVAAVAVSAAFATAADAEKKPAGKPADPDAVFAKKDKDSDGKLTKEEFTAGAKDPAKAETVFAKKDKDGDGKLSKEEFAAHGNKKKDK